MSLRRAVQLLLLGLFVYLLSLTRWPPSNTVLVDAFLRIDPLLALQASLAGRTLVGAALYGAVLLGLTLLLGRFFCGWMCPLGTCLELGDDLFFGKKKRLWKNRERSFRGVKYGLLAIIIVGALFGQGLAYLADPICWITRVFTYAVWPFGAAAGNLAIGLPRPVFERLGWMNLARMNLSQPVFGGFGIVALLYLAALIALGRWQRRFWCRSLCPLGALLAIPARFSLFHRKVYEACDADGQCVRRCEMGAIADGGVDYDPGECIQCGHCAKVCHLKAVVTKASLAGAGKVPSFDLSRRQAMGYLGTGAVSAAYLALNPDRIVLSDGALRPPGALPEDDFLATCVRCGQCVKACPTHMLRASALETGVAGFMTPVAAMRVGPCDQNCNACGEVCPTDAIRSLTLAEKPYAKIGNAVIEPGRCVVWEQGKTCLVCDENCPYGAIVWKETAGERRPYVDENKCNGCGQCEHACPVDGRAAIRVFPAGQIRLRKGSYVEAARERGLVLKRGEILSGEGGEFHQ